MGGMRKQLRHFTIEPEHAGLPAEDYLSRVAGLTPRSAVKRAFQNKAVFVGSKPVKRQDVLQSGDHLRIEADDVFTRDELEVAAVDLPLDVVLETTELVVINKLSGQNAHPLRPSEKDTALNALAHRYPECAGAFAPERPLEGGLVHRIDRGTSGLLVCARNLESWAELKATWNTRRLTKIYLAWLTGELTGSGTYECFLLHDPKSKKRMLVREQMPATEKAWEACTSFEPLQTVTTADGPATLALIRIHTGVTHQIRAVMSALGHAIIGDKIYKPKPHTHGTFQPLDHETASAFKACRQALGHALHTPRLEDLPEHGFFLHAFYLQSSPVAALKNGIFAPPPRHFTKCRSF